MATIQELLNIGKEKLESTGNEYAKYERKVLLEEVLGCNYMFMLMNPDEEVSLEKETEYLRLIEERCKHYPLQYLLGYAHFMDYTFCEPCFSWNRLTAKRTAMEPPRMA